MSGVNCHWRKCALFCPVVRQELACGVGDYQNDDHYEHQHLGDYYDHLGGNYHGNLGKY